MSWGAVLKSDTLVLSIAVKDRRTPWYVKLICIGIVAYAISPIDLIPDFIPILGIVDDLLLIPIGLSFVRRLIPDEILSDARTTVESHPLTRRTKMIAATLVISLWIGCIVLIGALVWWWW